MIEGTLINLRARELADAERNARWLSDPGVAFRLGQRYPRSVAAAEAELREHARNVAPAGDLRLAIETRDRRHIGNISLFNISPENRSAHVAIFIGEEQDRSKGYGADAMRTLLRFAFDEMNLHRVELDVWDDNERAIRSYRGCGFSEEGRLRQAHYERGAYHDAIIMAVLRDQWAR